jgi:pectinesterase
MCLKSVKPATFLRAAWRRLPGGELMVDEAQERVEAEHGVVYGIAEDTPLLLDVYRPPGRKDSEATPAVVLIHGGGMWTGSRTHLADTARRLAQAGYVAFSVDYRRVDADAGRHRWPAQLGDVQRAVSWVRARAADYGFDAERIGLRVVCRWPTRGAPRCP